MSKAVGVEFSGDLTQDFVFADTSLVLKERFLFWSICGQVDQNKGILEEIVLELVWLRMKGFIIKFQNFFNK